MEEMIDTLIFVRETKLQAFHLVTYNKIFERFTKTIDRCFLWMYNQAIVSPDFTNAYRGGCKRIVSNQKLLQHRIEREAPFR